MIHPDDFELLGDMLFQRVDPATINALLAEAYPAPADKRAIWAWLTPFRREYLKS
jgi:hypothetical protein